MRILLVHNRYQQPGGEDAVFEADRDLLIRHGHDVDTYERRNAEIAAYSMLLRLDLLRRTSWAGDSRAEIYSILQRRRYDVVHFFNTFPLVSPAAYAACSAALVPVVQTIQNYRLLCPSATLLREDRVCEDCVGKTAPWPAILHACYRSSRPQSAATALMLMVHNLARTWRNRVQLFVTPTEFLRGKLIQGGMPGEKIRVRPNHLYPDPGARQTDRGFALFVGRASPEKGLAVLVDAAASIPGLTLKIAGDGPLLTGVRQMATSLRNVRVEFLGWKAAGEVLQLIKEAAFLVVPSLWYEGLPMTVVESSACGTPVIASRIGGLAETVRHEESGLLFEPGSAVDLARQMRRLVQDSSLRRALGVGARAAYERAFSAEAAYSALMQIYYLATTYYLAPTRVPAARARA